MIAHPVVVLQFSTEDQLCPSRYQLCLLVVIRSRSKGRAPRVIVSNSLEIQLDKHYVIFGTLKLLARVNLSRRCKKDVRVLGRDNCREASTCLGS